ncbi:HIT family protein [Rhodococcus sp. NPDC059969]|uniref:HIT family protein n=1 Tax=Rhodococcus sp. NPDC059969 TaxID=3347018 RepID=UPI00366B591F
MSTDTCVFCKIVALTEPAILVHESETTLAFLDARPVSRGHTLVVPKRHAENLDALENHEGAEMFRVGTLIAGALRRCDIAADGVNFLVNDGRAAGQTVFHSHLHVVPRHRGDKAKFAAGLLARRAVELEQVGSSIRSQLTV